LIVMAPAAHVRASPQQHSVLVVDDHAVLRESLAMALAADGFTVDEQVGNVADALAAVGRGRPDVVIVDLHLPDRSGLDLARRLFERHGNQGIVLFTGLADPRAMDDALALGIRGLVLKGSPLSTLLTAARSVAAGGTYVDPAARRLIHGEPVERPPLSLREREVLARVADGGTIEGIADELGIAMETVRTHVRNCLRKTGTRSRAHAVATALRAGWI
jgi:DNA-binding NarL/FixJ family response regulator